jgi:hypothetical protein
VGCIFTVDGANKDGRHTYNGVLPSAPKGSFVTLLSVPQFLAAFSMMPHTLALLYQSPVCHPMPLPRSRLGGV